MTGMTIRHIRWATLNTYSPLCSIKNTEIRKGEIISDPKRQVLIKFYECESSLVWAENICTQSPWWMNEGKNEVEEFISLDLDSSAKNPCDISHLSTPLPS